MSAEALARIATTEYIQTLRDFQSHHVFAALSHREKESPLAAFTLNRVAFDVHVHRIRLKADEMQDKALVDPTYVDAARVANCLYDDLMTAKQSYWLSDDPIAAGNMFKQVCLQAIDEARPVLEIHRGWSEVLLDFANVLVSLLTLGFANIVSGRLRLFETKTDSAEKLAALETSVDDLVFDLGAKP